MKLLNFIWTAEGTEMLDFGPEGKYWTKPTAGEKDEDGKTAILNTAWNKFYSADSKQNEGWDQMGPIFQSKEWRRGQVTYPISSPDGLATLLRLETEKNYSGKQPKEVFPGSVWISDTENQQYALYQTNINKFVKQRSAEFIVGTKSIEQNWDAYLKGLDGLGLKQYLQMAQKAMKQPFNTSDFKQTPGVVEYLEGLK
jgi:putative aldouronate transport system substrate-binding protein